MMNQPLSIGIIGFGNFGKFVAESLADSSLVRVGAVTDPTLISGKSTEEILRDPAITAVHIATPPDSHAALAIAALEASKHVVIEKPLALTVADGQRVVAAAKKHQRIAAVNYVMRYNPVLQRVRQLITTNQLGRFHWLRLENIAGAVTPADHWFWDMTKSGGILVEHGVHFFDAATWLLDTAPADVSGKVYLRHGKNTESRATVRFRNGGTADFYHAFITDRALERTSWLLVWDKAQLEITGWIPLTARLTMSGAIPNEIQKLGFTSRTNDPNSADMVLPDEKQVVYAASVRAVWEDIARAVSEGKQPQISAAAAAVSLETACQVTEQVPL